MENSWKMHQNNDESLLKHHGRFMAAVEHIEDVSGKIVPDKMTEGDKRKQAGISFWLVCSLQGQTRPSLKVMGRN